VQRGKFPIVLGGEHSITPPVVSAWRKISGVSVLQIDAHADLRESFMGTPHNMPAPCAACSKSPHHTGWHQKPVGRRGGRRARSRDDDLLRLEHAASGNWIDRVVETLATSSTSPSIATGSIRR